MALLTCSNKYHPFMHAHLSVGPQHTRLVSSISFQYRLFFYVEIGGAHKALAWPQALPKPCLPSCLENNVPYDPNNLASTGFNLTFYSNCVGYGQRHKAFQKIVNLAHERKYLLMMKSKYAGKYHTEL